MQAQHTAVFGAFLIVLAAGCDRAESGQGAGGGEPTAATSTLSELERIALRAEERWKRVAAENWIEAYDYLPPDERKTLTLMDYLQGKTRHRYESPEAPEVLQVEGDVAYVWTACMWTPVHPALANVKLGPGESLTERLEAVETWKRTAGEWFYADVTPVREFFAAHPDVRQPSPKAPSSGGG
jgi:hypothetical protein